MNEGKGCAPSISQRTSSLAQAGLGSEHMAIVVCVTITQQTTYRCAPRSLHSFPVSGSSFSLFAVLQWLANLVTARLAGIFDELLPLIMTL